MVFLQNKRASCDYETENVYHRQKFWLNKKVWAKSYKEYFFSNV